MRAKSLALLALALGCGLVASLGITQVMARRGGDPPVVNGETQTVFVASKDIPLGDPLTADAVKLEQWPKDRVPAGALTRMEDVEGRMARSRFFAGEPILEQKLYPKGTELPGTAGLIPKGYRVVTVRVDAQSASGNLLLPGTRVDLLVHMARNPAIGIQETTTKTVLQDIKVFAVNDVVNMDAAGHDTKSILARTVSLLVSPSQAEKVTLASELGTIRLIMRSPEDDVQSPTKGALPQELFGSTDGARREKESLVPPDAIAGNKDKADGFLKFLKSMQDKMAAEKAGTAVRPDAARDSARWFMRVLKGAEVGEVELECGEQVSAADMDFSIWKVRGLPGAAASKVDRDPEPARAAALPEPAKPAKDESRPSKDEPKPVKDLTKALGQKT